jgi:hypothetical protein
VEPLRADQFDCASSTGQESAELSSLNAARVVASSASPRQERGPAPPSFPGEPAFGEFDIVAGLHGVSDGGEACALVSDRTA